MLQAIASGCARGHLLASLSVQLRRWLHLARVPLERASVHSWLVQDPRALCHPLSIEPKPHRAEWVTLSRASRQLSHRRTPCDDQGLRRAAAANEGLWGQSYTALRQLCRPELPCSGAPPLGLRWRPRRCRSCQSEAAT
eukprot:scaffold3127_cov202-Prasinococcus_capsulatus_cf.AAC.3